MVERVLRFIRFFSKFGILVEEYVLYKIAQRFCLYNPYGKAMFKIEKA